MDKGNPNKVEASWLWVVRTSHKPCHFYKIRDIFAPNLVSFTLWLAIAAFAATIAFSLQPNNIKWMFGVWGMNISEAAVIFIQSIIIIVFVGILGLSALVIILMFVTFLVVNCIRGIVAIWDWRMRDKLKNTEKRKEALVQKVNSHADKE